MTIRSPIATIALGVSLVLFFAGAAGAQAQPTIPVRDIRPGMRGYGLTVFSGTEPERFDVEVVGVLTNYLPRQDLILIRCRHPVLEHSGIVAGMSGSPIYIEGRLAGALAYGWRFAKDPVAGVTPIDNMFAELSRPVRGLPGARTGLLPVSLPTLMTRGPPLDDYWSNFHRDDTQEALVPAAAPLFVTGFGRSVRAIVDRLFSPFGLVPLQGGGGGRSRTGGGPSSLVAGGALGVQLMRGDMDASAIGTVTALRDGRVLAFGHPMFNSGQTQVPVTTARVLMFLASLQRSFKIAEPIAEVGSLVQDRQSCIIADPRRRAQMVPIRVTARRQGEPAADTYRMEIVQHRFLTPALALVAASNALEASSQDVADVTYDTTARIDVHGHARLDLSDHGFAPGGMNDPGEIGGLRVFDAIGRILSNPFQEARIDGIEIDLSLRFARDVSEIRAIYLVSDQLEASERVNVYVSLLPYGGSVRTEVVPIEIPREAAGREIEIEVAAGDRVRPDLAEPENLPELLHNLRQAYPASSLVVSVRLPAPGVALRGHVVRALPPSALEALRPANSSDTGDPFMTAERTVVPLGRVLLGRERIRARVREVVR